MVVSLGLSRMKAMSKVNPVIISEVQPVFRSKVTMNKVLVVDDDRTFNLMLKTFLTKNDFAVTQAYSATESLKIINNKEDFDLILVDLRLPDKTGLDLLKEIRSILSGVPVILMTSYADIKTAVTAIKMGAFEYVTKPINPDELLIHIKDSLNRKRKVSENASLAGINNQYVSGSSKEAAKINDYINLVAPTNMSVLVQGESGTGKEYVSRMIHEKSKRAGKPFVAVDCGALSKDLAASELFGHVKGSFTGAVTDKEGQFVVANEGTLFLDEIGNLSYDIQVKLLRAIQEKSIRKVGGNKDIKVNVRLITASNEDLADSVKKGNFREDLYHRLNEFKVEVPPLRDRDADVEQFALHFLKIANTELEKNVKGFSEEVLEKFFSYPWPGNLRELRNVVRRSVLLCTGDTITTEHLPSEMFSGTGPSRDAGYANGGLKMVTEQKEREMIISTLEKVRFNKSKAARILNIDRKTLYNKLKFYEIDL